MGKELLIILLGFFVAVLPFLGFPMSIDTILFAVAGISIALLGVLVRRDIIEHEARSSRMRETYTQNPLPEESESTEIPDSNEELGEAYGRAR